MTDPTILITANGYTTGLIYTVIPTDFDGSSGFLNWTRASTKTRVNGSGVVETMANNIPTLDYTDSVCPVIGIEPQRTNLYLRSEDITNAYWTKTGATASGNTQNAPNDTLTADSLISTNSTGRHEVSRAVSLNIGSPGNTFTASFYVKKGNVDYAYIECVDTYWLGTCIINLNNGVVETKTGTNVNVLVSLINGYYRISMNIPRNQSGSPTSPVIRFGMTSSSSSTSSTLTTSDFTYMWGFQLEQIPFNNNGGFFPSSYIQTVASTVTRIADACSMPSTMNQYVGLTEGTLFVKINFKAYNSPNTYISANSATITSDSSNRITGAYTSSASIVSSAYPDGVLKIAFGYKLNSFVLYINGVLIGTDNVGTVSPTTGMGIGGNCNQLIYGAIYTERLSNSDLAELTTL